MNSKTEFLANKFSLRKDYSKSFVFDIFRDDKFSNQNLTCWKTFNSKSHFLGKSLLHILILFFRDFHFKLWFSMERLASKSCLLKWARKVKNLLFSVEHIESKRFFFRCEFFIEIWFLSKKWTQKLSFRKTFFLQSMIVRKVFHSNSAGRKKSQFKNWLFENFLLKFLLCRKTFTSESDSFFSENFIWNTDFQWKGLLQSHAF